MAFLELARSVLRDSRLLGKADRNRHHCAVAGASGIWRSEHAVRLVGGSPEKSRIEPSSPTRIAS